MRPPVLTALALLTLAAPGAGPNAARAASSVSTVSSELWGTNGERWLADGRLPDFSYAGYHRGEQSPPVVAQSANVKDFGAVGDGVADDTAAIQAAIDATKAGAVFLPPGRYKVTDFIRIKKSGLVLRGAGAERSVLWMPRGLDEIHPKAGRTSEGLPASGYSFGGAFVTLEGSYRAQPLARVTATARRGERSVEVDDPAKLAVGRLVLLVLSEDPAQTLKTHLYNDDPGDIRRGKNHDTKLLLTIVAVEGRRVTFDRPLRVETRAAWKPELRSFSPTVSESGVEDLGFEFPATQYRGHFKENGANAIELGQVYNCWVRRVTIHNGDLGVNVHGCHNTLDGIVTTAAPGRGIKDGGVAECTGHHAIWFGGAEDNLAVNFDLRASYIHDLSVEHASGNVFAHGRGRDLDFDHHKDTPFENLFTDLDCGAGTRVWRCGGGNSLGRQTAGWATFWNIRAAQPIAPPPKGWGPWTMNFVGLTTSAPSTLDPAGIWFEALPPAELSPANLHAAQLERRTRAAAPKADQKPRLP